MRLFASLTILATTCILASPAALAAEPKLRQSFTDWKVYTFGEGSRQICYALAKPRSKSPKNVKHGDVFFMVASWKDGSAIEQPSLMTGYSFKVSSPPKVRVGSSRTTMYSEQNEAFIEDNSDEKRLIKSMKGGSVMRVSAVSARGTATSYEFSLKGVTAALKKSKGLCN